MQPLDLIASLERAVVSDAGDGVGQHDVEGSTREFRPSIGACFDTARKMAMYADDDGTADDLLAYLRKRRGR